VQLDIAGDAQQVEPGGLLLRDPPHTAVHRISLLQQQFRQVGAVLTRDAGDECCFH
jgi:hypothetical protein